jgi:uncharacterized protein YlxP (DUF503 family)
MTVGVLRFRLRLPSRSLKEKRSIVKSLVERLRGRFNASVAEVDELDEVGAATIAVVVVSNDGGHADSQLRTILQSVHESRLDAELLDVETELIAL